MARLHKIVGVAGDWRDDHPGTMFGAGLLGVALSNATGIVVSDDDNGLRAAKLADRAGDRHQIAGAVSNRAGATSRLVNCRRCSKALGNINDSGLVHRAEHPEFATSLGAGVIELAAGSINVLEAAERAIRAIQGHHQAAVSGDSGAVRLDAFALEVFVLGACRPRDRPDFRNGVGRHCPRLGQLLIAKLLGLGQSPSVGHFLGCADWPPDISAEGDFNPCPPASEAPGGDAIRVNDVPARFVSSLA